MPDMLSRRLTRYPPIAPATLWSWAVALVVAAVAIALLLFVPAPAHADAGGARAALARALVTLKAGNISAARKHARDAVREDDKWGLAHAVLARTLLAIGDGIGAEAELDRARDAGFDMGRGHHLLAHARLLQGDTDGALKHAAKAGPAYAGYALRVAARAYAAKNDLPRAQALLARVLATNPLNSAAWGDLGRVRYTGGDIAGAIDAATKAINLDGNNIEALTLRAELVRTQYGLVAALPWFEAALKRDYYYHPALIEYAATLGDAGRHVDMLSATRRALAARPGSPQAYYLQAVLAARAGKDDLARTLLQRAGGSVAALPGALLLSGLLDYAAGGNEQAIAKWRELVGRQPMNITARRLLGAALLRSGDAQGALDVLRPVALRFDADSYTLMLAARAFERTGDRDWAGKLIDRASFPLREAPAPFGSDDSLETMRLAVAENPDDPVRRTVYLRALIDAGDTRAALVEAQALVRLSPGAAAAHLALGDTLMVLGRYGEAVNAFARAASIRFDEPTMLRSVDALERAGRKAEAANVLALFLSQNPQNIAAQRLAGHWQIAGGQFDAAIETLEGLRERLGNRDAALLAELAQAYLGDGEDDVALRYARAAYRLAPLNPAAADAYGWALYQTGDAGAATQLLEKAISIAPEHAMIRWHLAQAYAELGRAPDARREIQAALADPSFDDRDAATALLNSLG